MGDYTYLYDSSYYNIDMTTMIMVYLFSWLEMGNIWSLPFLILWAMLSVYQIGVLVLYEYFVLGISFDDEIDQELIEGLEGELEQEVFEAY